MASMSVYKEELSLQIDVALCFRTSAFSFTENR
jgi:hypothetical protein